MFAKASAIGFLILYMTSTTAMDVESAFEQPEIPHKVELHEDIDSKMMRLKTVAFQVLSRNQKPPEALEQVLHSIFTLHHHDEELAQVMILSLNEDHVCFLRQIFEEEVTFQTKVWESLNANLENMKSQFEDEASLRRKEQNSLLKLSQNLNSQPIKGNDKDGMRLRQQVIERLQETISKESERKSLQSAKESETQEALNQLEDTSNVVDIFDKILLLKATMNSLGDSDKK